MKVDKFIFPVDFIVMDFEADYEVPIILGRPFLATGRTLIDVHKRELTMRVNDEQVTFKVMKAIQDPDDIEDCSAVNITEGLPLATLQENHNKDPYHFIQVEKKAQQAPSKNLITRRLLWELTL